MTNLDDILTPNARKNINRQLGIETDAVDEGEDDVPATDAESLARLDEQDELAPLPELRAAGNGGDSGESGTTNAWGDFEALDTFDVPAFPVASLSPMLHEWCLAQAEFSQVPVDLPACIALAATSLATMRRFRVQVRRGWEEASALWLVVALDSGERKSPCFAAATAPVYAFFDAERTRLEHQIIDRARERRILEGKIKEAEQKAIRNQLIDGQSALQTARELQSDLDDMPEIRVPAMLADDATPEALAIQLAANEERMGIFSPEGGPFEIMAGRYSDKGRSNLEIYLKSHVGEPHIVNRVGRESLALKEPLLAMGLTVQPTVISGLAAKDGFRGRGLLARFLYSLPKTVLGRRRVDSAEVPEVVTVRYATALREILGGDRSTTRVLVMNPDADRARSLLQQQIEPRLGPDGDLATMTDWGGKFVGAVCRIAGVLHVADYASERREVPATIPRETFLRAWSLGEYFLEHARVAFGMMGTDAADDGTKRLWSWLVRQNVERFTKREAERALHMRADEIRAPVAELERRGLIRALPPPQRVTGRLPSPSFEVNPKARDAR